MKKIFMLTLCAVMSVQMSSCKNRKYMRDPKFQVSAYWDADEYYPMELVYGCFYCPDGKGGLPMRSGGSKVLGIKSRPWGEADHSSWSDEPILLPNRLYLKWYSFVEDKSYEGSFELPYNKLLEIFQQKILRSRLKDYRDYSSLVVGLAPGGQAYLWAKGLASDEGGQIFVAKFQAHETHIDQKILTGPYHYEYEEWPEERWPEIMERYRRETFCGKIEDNYNAKGLQLGLWDSYNERFNWRPVMVYEDSTAGWETDEIYMSFYNGEDEALTLEPLKENAAKSRPRIRRVVGYHTDWTNFRFVDITFDEEELFAAYTDIFGDNPDKEVILEIRLNEANDFFRVFLVSLDPEDHRKSVEFRRARIKRYRETYQPAIDWFYRK
jgi:hypothetical protein